MLAQQTLHFGQTLVYKFGMLFSPIDSAKLSHCKLLLIHNFMHQNTFITQTILDMELVNLNMIWYNETSLSMGKNICQITEYKPQKPMIDEQNEGTVVLATYSIKHMYKSFMDTSNKICHFKDFGCFHILYFIWSLDRISCVALFPCYHLCTSNSLPSNKNQYCLQTQSAAAVESGIPCSSITQKIWHTSETAATALRLSIGIKSWWKNCYQS